jgi:3-oxoacyl-(acyl-carrier-protein) synthase/3-hydroxymyristoyl/3-hydroxydecanoyl-(acyl carrier protein) dehydratase/1-acyl-sn-glycerol-3-phosphate acyltransferase
MLFEPIAIVGRSCILPDALDPEALARNVLAQRLSLAPAPAERWGVPRDWVLTDPAHAAADRAWSDVSGTVRGFETVFDPRGFGLDEEIVRALDPLFQWVLHGTRAALHDASLDGRSARAGLVLGNLSLPSTGMARYVEQAWVAQQPAAVRTQYLAPPHLTADLSKGAPAARNRFMSGLPAHLAAQALGLGAGAYALDAACASSLYAIKLACDRLHDRSADVMVAGAVNRADDLFLRIGFCALSALSRSGRSRPFHRDADGLLCAEGAAFVVLKRLRDAVAGGDRICGVIRGIGLANDGRGAGLLVPAQEGQERALRSAYAMAEVAPASVSLIECHATGTQVGDATEIATLARVFAGCRDVPIGSLKSNLGHLITTAGAAGLLKVLAAMQAGVRPATLGADAVTGALREPLRVLHASETWSGQRRAAVSAFGFGGNNAHLIVDAWEGKSAPAVYVRPPPGLSSFGDGVAPSDLEQAAAPSAPRAPVAIVALGARVGGGTSTRDLALALCTGRPDRAARATIEVALDGLRFPPRDLEHTLPQQLLLLEAAREAARGLALPRERTWVLIGMGCDTEVARYNARWRIPAWLKDPNAAQPAPSPSPSIEGARRGDGFPRDRDTLRAHAQDAFQAPLDTAAVLGTMPNIVANRINVQLDLAGPSMTVAAEEASGLVALQIAERALQTGEADAVLVGAVDLSHEVVHQAALAALGRARPPGDAAVVLVLKRAADARRDGDHVLALLGGEDTPALHVGNAQAGTNEGFDPAALLGAAHAAHGLVAAASAVLALYHGMRPRTGHAAQPWSGARTAAVSVDVLGAPATCVRLRGADEPSGTAGTLSEQIDATWPMPATQSKPLLLPAHRPPVVLPALELPAETLAASAFELMRPAPPLPSVSASFAGTDAPPEATKSPVLEPPASVSPRPRLVGSAEAQLVALHSARLARAVEVHRAHVTQQADVHQAFLRVRQQAAARLLRTYAGARAQWAAPSIDVPPPAQPVRALKAEAPAGARPYSEPPPWPLQSPARLPALRSAPPAFAAAQTTPQSGPAIRFNRAQLEALACGNISALFGPQFAPQDAYARQTRMPMPPLLLADRVTRIEAVPASMQRGAVWTETDVARDAWYLDPAGRMPAGLTIEAGQADLLLISWLGIDLLNRGTRVYRLLGCDVTFHGSLPRPGETLQFEIHIDGHAQQGDVRLFFFHYDCTVNGAPRLSMRHGQAGFFTDEELANTGGVLWDPAAERPPDHAAAPLEAPAPACTKRAFTRADLLAFADGNPAACFGPGWAWTRAHVRTPRIAAGRLLLLDEVTCFEPRGGPWARGYLRAQTPVAPDDWFFAGHFKNDPCMPGTLMFEGCLQALAFYLAALGTTIERDGWRFEPVPELTIKMRCRGQVTPASRLLTYEVFVREVVHAPQPRVCADVLCTVDGVKAFHASGVGLQLVPDYPLTHWRALGPHTEQTTGAEVVPHALAGLVGYREPRPVARDAEGFAYDYASLLACAWGRPPEMFGAMYAPMEGPRRVARLPGPPYHFMSRVVEVSGPLAGLRVGSHVVAEYDVPRTVWYLEQNGSASMPLAVLMETALQPCGWLATYVGVTLAEIELLPRNLDGNLRLSAALGPDTGTVRTRATLTSLSRSAETIIVAFAIECWVGEQRAIEANTVFGFFPPAAFAQQIGVPTGAEDAARLTEPSDFLVDLRARPPRYCAGALRLPGPMLLMLDRVTGYWPQGGKAGLGRLRAEKTVDPGEWFFKAHFFQDPVQPGSLGIEALTQLLQFWMIESGCAEGLSDAHFEPLMLEQPFSWKYRGQVTPAQRLIRTEIEITESGTDARGRYVIAEGRLWADDTRIYHVQNLGVRIVGLAVAAPAIFDATLDPAVDTWVRDHCPTWTVPALPMMSMADRLAAAVAQHTQRTVVALRDVQVRRWLPLPGPVQLRIEVANAGAANLYAATLSLWRAAPRRALSRYEPVATGLVQVGDYPAAPALPRDPLTELNEVADPYRSAVLPHGPAFQYVRRWQLGARGARAVLDAGTPGVPRGQLHQGLLDSMTHAIPHDALWQWSSEITRACVGYPHRIAACTLYAPLPERGEVEVEARLVGFEDRAHHLPIFELTIWNAAGLLAHMRLTEALVPKGNIGSAAPLLRRKFLHERSYAAGVGLSVTHAGTTQISAQDFADSDWLAGTVARSYALSSELRGEERLAEVAVRDHVARQVCVHPSQITVAGGATQARPMQQPYRLHRLSVLREPGLVTVRDAAPPACDLTPARLWWRKTLGMDLHRAWPGEDVFFALAERCVADVVVVDPAALAAARARACLYLANHQVGAESMLFNVLAAPLLDRPIVTVAKAEHRASWIGRLTELCFAFPGVAPLATMLLIERDNPQQVAQGFAQLAATLRAGSASALVHVEGTRALACRRPVAKLSSALIDVALAAQVPIVPVRFAGGLPVEPLAARIEFPLGFGGQTYFIGRPIAPADLAGRPNKERVAAVLAALNNVGPALSAEVPATPDEAFAARVAARRAQGVGSENAVIVEALRAASQLSEPLRALLAGLSDDGALAPSALGTPWCRRLADFLGLRETQHKAGDRAKAQPNPGPLPDSAALHPGSS